MLRQLLVALQAQVSKEREVVLFQDGAMSPHTGVVRGDAAKIEASIATFHELMPHGTVHASKTNLGIARNINRAECYVFETLQAEAGIFLEDDLVLGPHYLDVVETLVAEALVRETVGYVAALGNFAVDLSTQTLTPRKLRPLHLLWGFGLSRRHWLKMRPYILEYLGLISTSDYPDRDHAAIQDMTLRWGVEPGDTAQDRIKAFATALVGCVKVNTEISYARYIGSVGVNFDVELFRDWKLDRMQIADCIHTKDFDWNAPKLLEPWALAHNVERYDAERHLRHVTSDEVRQLYWCLLGREPEDDDVVAAHVLNHNFAQTRQSLLLSGEFRQSLKSMDRHIHL